MSRLVKDFSGAADLRRMQRLVQAAWVGPSIDVENHIGDLAWAHSHITGRQASMPRRLWLDGPGPPIAWGWVFQPGELMWQVAPGRLDLLADVLDWALEIAEGRELVTTALDTDPAAAAVLMEQGFAEDPGRPYMVHLLRDLAGVDPPSVPDGFRMRTVTAQDLDKRVAVHRDAWAPSRFSRRSYQAVRRTWPFREDLDCVVEAPDGSFAASVLAWLDDEAGVGEFEPVGTAFNFRRMGLGRALSLFTLRRLAEEGASTAMVHCRGDIAYPIPKRLYESVGFRQHARSRMFVRVRP